jgi:hypothetical protein
MSANEKPYGWQVTYERRTGRDGWREEKCRCKGTELAAIRNAKMKIGFVRVVKTEAFTKEQYRRCFGEGAM